MTQIIGVQCICNYFLTKILSMSCTTIICFFVVFLVDFFNTYLLFIVILLYNLSTIFTSIFITNKEMVKTWTVVRFEEENVVEAVPTNWIANGKCYWPPYTKDKILKAIKEHVHFESTWTSYQVYVFKNSTSESYHACRLKAKKAEDTSELSSDHHKKKRKIIKNRIYSSESSDNDYDNDRMIPSPPVLEESSDSETSKRVSRSGQINTLHVKEKCYNKENHRPLEINRTDTESIGETMMINDSSINIPGPSNTSVYSCSIQQKSSQKDVNMHRFNANCNTSIDKQTLDTANHCTCCPKHKNYNETFRKIFKELFLLRELTKECCEDLKVTFLQKCNAATTDEGEPTFLSTFHFPLQSVEDLNEVEQYLEQPNRFQSTVKELSKMGGTTPYDFVKRCLSLLLSNRLAGQIHGTVLKRSKYLENFLLQMYCKKVLFSVKQHKIEKRSRKV